MEISEALDFIKSIPYYELRLEFMEGQAEELVLIRMVAKSEMFVDDVMEHCFKTWDYGNVKFTRVTVTSADFIQILEDISVKQIVSEKHTGLNIAAKCSWPIKESNFDYSHFGSKSLSGLYRGDLPYHTYVSQFELERVSGGVMEPLIAKGLLYFETLIEAEMYYLYDRFIQYENYIRHSLQIIIDDRRGWFEEILIGKSILRFVLGGELLDDCEIKLVGRNPNLSLFCSAMTAIEDGIKLQFMPLELSVLLTCGREIIDRRIVSERQNVFQTNAGVQYEKEQQENIEDFLHWRGESRTLEYKSEISKTVLNTIVAFANAEGGSIIFGVKDDDNGIEIIGVPNVDELKLQITDLMDRTSGVFEHYFYVYTINNKTVVRLEVLESNDKPIAVTVGSEHKFYIRRDGSTRRLRREDFINFKIRGD